MKSKEEIEQLAESIYHQMFSSNIFVIEQSKGFITGYTQCSLDMADKKYTEKDIIDAVLFGMQKGLSVGKVDETDNNWVNNYINSLIKQD